MLRFFPCVPELPQQVLCDRDMFVVNFARVARYQNSAIVYCQKPVNALPVRHKEGPGAGEGGEVEGVDDWARGEDQEEEGGAGWPGGRGEPG